MSTTRCNEIPTRCSLRERVRPQQPSIGLQRKRAATALSQAGRTWPDQPIRAIQTARRTDGRPHRPPADRMYATDVRQTDRRQTASSLNKWGIINDLKQGKALDIPMDYRLNICSFVTQCCLFILAKLCNLLISCAYVSWHISTIELKSFSLNDFNCYLILYPYISSCLVSKSVMLSILPVVVK